MKDMSYTPEDESIAAKTRPRCGILGVLQSSVRKIRGHLGIRSSEKRPTSPPSYQAALLQKNSGGSSRMVKLNVTPYEFLRKLDSELPPTTARSSETRVEDRLIALFATGTNSTLEWARRNPIAVRERVRHFLSYCVARDNDLDHLLSLSHSDREFFYSLAMAYKLSWIHQIVYGWDRTPNELQAQAYEMFRLFIEHPMRSVGLPVQFFLSHLQVFSLVHELPPGSSLFGGPHGTRLSTLQEIRSRAEFRALEELLRMNKMILDAVVEPESQVYATLKMGIEAERQISLPPRVWGNRWSYVMNDAPGWTEFKSINRDRHSNFPPLRQREEEDDKIGVDENAHFPRLPEVRHELESNPWA